MDEAERQRLAAWLLAEDAAEETRYVLSTPMPSEVELATNIGELALTAQTDQRTLLSSAALNYLLP